MADDPIKAGEDGAPVLSVVHVRGQHVVLDRMVAAAFGVETREVNQAVRRNPEKFTEAHVFHLTEDETEFLTSQGVIPKPGRGGSRVDPSVFSMKGVARLATIINSPQALRATDLIIDVFVEVWTQVARGATEIELSNPSRLLPAKEQDSKALLQFRRKLINALDGLLDTVVNPRTQATVRDELQDTAGTALEHVKALLKTRGLENDKIAAETMLILEQVRDLREKREAMIRRSHARTEAIALENLDKKIEIVQRLLAMADRMAPSALVNLYGELAPKGLSAPARKALIDRREKKTKGD